jgi:hypothetical protein
MEELYVLVLVGFTSIGEDLVGARGFGLTRERLRVAIGKMLTCLGATLVFFGLNLGVGMLGRHAQFVEGTVHRLHVALDADAEHPRPLPAVDRQHPVRRNPLDLLRVAVIVAERLLPALFLVLLAVVAFVEIFLPDEIAGELKDLPPS